MLLIHFVLRFEFLFNGNELTCGNIANAAAGKSPVTTWRLGYKGASHPTELQFPPLELL